MNRKNGTSGEDLAPVGEPDILVTYRELAPAPELCGYVRAFFSFTPGAAAWRGRHAVLREVRFTRAESFCSPQFADGHASLVLDLGATCHLGQGWTFGAPVRARVIGALGQVGGAAGSARSEMLGAYFRPGSTPALFQTPATELTDRVVDLEQVWGAQGARLADDLVDLDEAARVERLEAALIERMRRAPVPRLSVDVVGLARWVRMAPASITVRRLADAAGVSRQHLARLFRPMVGVSPKHYCRLARFQRGLVYAGAGPGVKWAEVAAELGYADQSHMIAEFRELSSLTPEALARQRWFHPFILAARSRLNRSPRPATTKATVISR